MGAPAIGAGNGARLAPHRLGFEGAAHVEVVVVEIADRFSQFARAEPAVVIDDDRGLAGRARHWPRLRGFEAALVPVEMEPQVALVI